MRGDRHPGGAALGLLARSPRYDRVKSRLARGIGRRAALRIYRRMLVETLSTLSAAEGSATAWIDGWVRHPWLLAQARRYGVRLRRQAAGDLGRRMAKALASGLREAPAAMVVGADCPGLEAALLDRASRELAGGADLVLGPSTDGGYYLLGLRRLEHELFRAMPWGTDRVLALTLGRARRLGMNVAWLPRRIDVDTRADLAQLPPAQMRTLL